MTSATSEAAATPYADASNEAEVRQATAATLHHEVGSMNLENFVVRPKRRLVEKYAQADAWRVLPADARAELAHEVAGLPSELDPENEEAKRFDLLMLNLQLALVRSEPGFQRLRNQVMDIAGLLEEKQAIPMVSAQMALILDLQTDEWWQDVTVPMLEGVRRKLRSLVQLIEKQRRRTIFTDFADEMGGEIPVELPGLSEGASYAKFRAKVRTFLRAHQDHIAIHKLRMNRPLTAADLDELERILVESGVGEVGDVRRAAEESQGLGLFVRSLIGLDRGAAKEALAEFLSGKQLKASQIEFVNMIVDHLTEHGVVDATMLYESPFTDLTPKGPDGLFSSSELDQLIAVLVGIRGTAVAA
jgi:type I restriction enzyme R subunit